MTTTPAICLTLAPHFVIEKRPQETFATGASFAQWVNVAAARALRPSPGSLVAPFTRVPTGQPPLPAHVCPFLFRVAEAWADSIDASWERGRLLGPVIDRLLGSEQKSMSLADRLAQVSKRKLRLLSWSWNVHVPAWLDAAGMEEPAKDLRTAETSRSNAMLDHLPTSVLRYMSAAVEDPLVARLADDETTQDLARQLRAGAWIGLATETGWPDTLIVQQRAARIAIARGVALSALASYRLAATTGQLDDATREEVDLALVQSYQRLLPLHEEMQASLQQELLQRLDGAERLVPSAKPAKAVKRGKTTKNRLR